MVKLTNEQFKEIENLLQQKNKVSDIAKKYNVSTTCIYNIQKKKKFTCNW